MRRYVVCYVLLFGLCTAVDDQPCPRTIDEHFVEFTYSRDASNLLGGFVILNNRSACATRCLAYSSCVAYNWREASSRCELKNATFPDVTTSYNQWWSYYFRQVFDCTDQDRTTVEVPIGPNHSTTTVTDTSLAATVSTDTYTASEPEISCVTTIVSSSLSFVHLSY